jgi:hypothetical protein
LEQRQKEGLQRLEGSLKNLSQDADSKIMALTKKTKVKMDELGNKIETVFQK